MIEELIKSTFQVFWCANRRGWMWASKYCHGKYKTKYVNKTTTVNIESLICKLLLGYECARWAELTIDETVLGKYFPSFETILKSLIFFTLMNLGRICTSIQLIDDVFFTRLSRSSRSADGNFDYSRQKRQSQNFEGEIYDNSRIICEVKENIKLSEYSKIIILSGIPWWKPL